MNNQGDLSAASPSVSPAALVAPAQELPSAVAPAPQQPRETIIGAAVDFLNNPKVSNAPTSRKLAFLESKGLTAPEVALALQRVNASQNAAAVPPPLPPMALHLPLSIPQRYQTASPHQLALQPQTQKPAWGVRDLILAAVATGGVCLSLFSLTKQYIAPVLSSMLRSATGAADKLDEEPLGIAKLRDAQQGTAELVLELRNSVAEMSRALLDASGALRSAAALQGSQTDAAQEVRLEVAELRETVLPELVAASSAANVELLCELKESLVKLREALADHSAKGSGNPSANFFALRGDCSGSGVLVNSSSLQSGRTLILSQQQDKNRRSISPAAIKISAIDDDSDDTQTGGLGAPVSQQQKIL